VAKLIFETALNQKGKPVNSQKNHSNAGSPNLSIVFSFRNEEEVLPELIRRTRMVLKEEVSKGNLSSYELIFVNDASFDDSLTILTEQAKGDNSIRIINMSRCFGVSPCVLAGMERTSGDLIIYMDTDLQDPPEIIPELLQSWRDEGDVEVVHTIRLSRLGESRIKLFITGIGYYILNKFSIIYLPVEAGDFKLLTRRAVDHLLQLRENHPFVRGLICWIGFKQSYVKYHRQSRFAGKTKFFVLGLKVLNNFFGSALIAFSSAPLKIASCLGLLAIFADFIIMGAVFLQMIQGEPIPEWTALMIVVLFLGGIQLFCIGIMGLYLNSVYEQSKNRPNYIIDSTVGFPDGALKRAVLRVRGMIS